MHSPTQLQIIKKAFSSPLCSTALPPHSVSSSTPRWQDALQVDIGLSGQKEGGLDMLRRPRRLPAWVDFYLNREKEIWFSAILQLLGLRKH